jgi:PKD repeat protein
MTIIARPAQAFTALILSLVLALATAGPAAAAPTADFTYSPSTPSAGVPIRFTFTGTCDVADCVVDWRWYRDANDRLGTTMDRGPVIDFTFNTAGSYIVVAKNTAQNSTHNFATASQVITVGAGVEPRVSITGAPPARTRATSAAFTFALADPDDAPSSLSTTCRLDGTSGPCSSPAAYTALREGGHVFSVTATDPAGHTGSDAVTWTVDTTPPVAQVAVGAGAFTLASAVDVAWSATDAAAGALRHDVRWRRAPFDSGFGQWVLPAAWQGTTTTHSGSPALAPGYTYCFASRATDDAGNTSAWSTARCVARPVDDRRASASPGWTRGNGALFYQRTHTSTTRLGSTLTRTGAQVARVGVVATTCPSCGVVAVSVGRTRVGTVDLHSAVTRRRQVLALAPFALRRGPVVVRTLSGGRLVQIDGLALSRS